MTKIIVDDAILEHLTQEKALFSRTDFSVIPCATKGQVLAAHEQENADLILIDYDMPELTIEHFCSDVRTSEKMKHAMIVIASEDRQEQLNRCLKCGVDSLIIKPLNHRELIDRTTQLLHIKKRKTARVLMKITVTGKTGETFYATSHDVSVTGISIIADITLSPGDNVLIIFYLRTNKIEVDGKIVRKQETANNLFHYGIQFLRIDDQSRSLIEIYVKMREDF
jgi:DNA-binding response OmpR family regulator